MEMTAIEARKAEIAEYEKNIAMFKAIAESTTAEWPTHLAHLKDAQNRHDVIAGIDDLDDVALVGDLWMRDDAVKNVRAATIEMRRSVAILAALEAVAG